MAVPRFPPPLIERSVRISRTTLSDWLHREAHDIARDRSRLSGGHRLRLAAELLPTAAGASGVCRLLPITMPSPSSGAHQKSGPFPPPALPGLSSNMTLSDTRRHRRLSATLRPLPSCQNGPPPITRITLPTCRAHYPDGSETGACVDCYPVHAAFPVIQAGRHPYLHFRGLLRLHSRYGPLDCSTAQGGLCHEASTRPVTRPGRSSATGTIDNSPGEIFLHWWFAPSGRTE